MFNPSARDTLLRVRLSTRGGGACSLAISQGRVARRAGGEQTNHESERYAILCTHRIPLL